MSDGKHIVILGSGPAGYVGAIRAAQLGMKATVVEMGCIGGTCLNKGCIPTKALLAASALYQHIEVARKLGLHPEPGAIDWPAMQVHQQKVVGRLRKGVEALFKARQIELVAGVASVKDAHTLSVKGASGETTEVAGDALLIASGSDPARPRWIGFGEDGRPPFEAVMTSDEALSMTKLPASAIVVGGGYIGCEFASMWADLGVKVTIVEMLPGILAGFDDDMGEVLFKSLRRRGVKMLLGKRIEKLAQSPVGVVASLADGTSVEAEVALVAVGRKPRLVEGLEGIGVAVENGAITVDRHCRTNVAGVSAAGDVTGRILLAHYASHQAVVAMENIAGTEREFEEKAVPGCAFTNPDAASVGLTEKEARATLADVKVGRYEFAHLGKAMASGETDGFAKVVADGKTGKVVGVHIIGAHAENLIQEGTLALKMGATLTDLAELIHPHPTMTEAIGEAALDALGRAIHKI